MPRRPRAHRLEDESRQHFRKLLPEEWVFRDETPDYGIDGEVEIFDNGGNSAGFRFHVQLKATDRLDSSFTSQVRLRRETVDYYHSLSRPILLVSYHSGSRRLYWRWFHLVDPYYGGFGKKWVRVSFAKADLWGPQTPATIETDLRLRRLAEARPLVLPVTVALTVSSSSAVGATQAAHIAAFRRLIRRHPTLVEWLAPTADGGGSPCISVFVDSEKAWAVLGRRFTATLHLRNATIQPRLFAYDLLLVIAMACSVAGQDLLGIKLALIAAAHSSLVSDPDCFFRIAALLARNHRVVEALDLAETIGKREGLRWTADSLQVQAMLQTPLSDGEQDFLRQYLERRIEWAAGGDDSAVAVAHYNLANYLRARAAYREALNHYLSARRYDRRYLRRDYFCQEMAGVLFESRRYSLSARLYKAILAAGRSPKVKPLLADALMFSGRYAEARRHLRGHCRIRTLVDPEWILKEWVLGEFVNQFKQKRQRRQPGAAMDLAGDLRKWGTRHESLMNRIVRLDALCGLAWFNYGTALLQRNKRTKAGLAFTVTAVVQRWDLAAWGNALALLKETPRYRELASIVMAAAWMAHGEKFVQHCFPTAMEEDRDELAELLHRELTELVEERTFTVRFLNDKGRYKSVEIPRKNFKGG